MEDSERRQARRYDVSANIHGHVRMSVDLRILNLSLTGIAAESQKMLRVGSHYTVRVENGGSTELDAIVRWCHLTRTRRPGSSESQTVYVVGLDFRHVLEEKAPELKSLVEHAAFVEVERRVFGRFRPRPDATATAKVDQEFALRRISFSGMLIETSGAPPVGSDVEFEMTTDGSRIAAAGRVANVEQRGERAVVGIGFTALPPDAQNNLEGFIAGLMA